MFGVVEILILVVMVVFVFGAKKLPEIGRDLGKAITSFKSEALEPERSRKKNKAVGKRNVDDEDDEDEENEDNR